MAMPATAESPRATQIPHRYKALTALRQLSRGYLLTEIGNGAFGVWLDGVLDVCCIQKHLMESGWVEPVAVKGALPAVRHYRLSGLGRQALDAGEKWWASLSWQESLTVRLNG